MKPMGVPKNKNYPGFTIVELLIVVVVIAILAAITVISYNNIRQRSESSALKSEMSQLQKKIQTDILQQEGESISITAPVGYIEGITTGNLTSPFVSAQEITQYVVFDTDNNPAGSNYSAVSQLNTAGTNNAFRLRTGAPSSNEVQAFYATSSQVNQSLNTGSILNTTGRHLAWISANSSTIYSGVDNTTDRNRALTTHTGWDFDSIRLFSGTGYAGVAMLVFPEFHDSKTRTQILKWLDKLYSVDSYS